jgi:hypothetical protein
MNAPTDDLLARIAREETRLAELDREREEGALAKRSIASRADEVAIEAIERS